MTYYARIGLASLVLALLTALLIWRGPQIGDVMVVAFSPTGSTVPAGAAISFTFSRPVDRRSAEQSFVITPVVPGRFFWSDRTLTFRPTRPLEPETSYQVTIKTGLRDAQGRANSTEAVWTFRTRSPQLLLVAAPGATPALWLSAADSSAAQPALDAPEGVNGVAISPDGRQAVVVVPRGPQRMALMLLDLESGSTRPLVDEASVSASGPAWSPLGDFIAFERRAVLEQGLGQARIWLAQPDGTSLGPLSGDGEEISYAPAWSPDGNRIAFVDGSTQALGIYDFFSDSRRNFADGSGETASWSPDSTRLVYGAVTIEASGPRLFLRQVDLAQDTWLDLTDGNVADHSPAWSPDGNWIAFVRRAQQGPGSSIWVMRADGSELREITRPGPYQDTLPTWSPDSQQIAFIRSQVEGALGSAAWVASLADGSAREIRANVVQALWVP